MTRLACWGILRSGSGPRVSGFQRRKPGLTIDEGLRAGYDKEKILTRELSMFSSFSCPYLFIVLRLMRGRVPASTPLDTAPHVPVSSCPRGTRSPKPSLVSVGTRPPKPPAPRPVLRPSEASASQHRTARGERTTAQPRRASDATGNDS